MLKPKDTYDAVIIGAGISGLVCGCYLAKAGMKVLIVEQHYKPGGYCTSFKRQGFTFDAAAHSFGGYRENGTMFRIINDLGLNLRIERYDPSDVIVTSDYRISLWNDPNRTVEELQSAFPHESKKIRDFFYFLSNSEPFDFVVLRKKTFRELLDQYFTDENLRSILSFPVLGNGGLPPSLISAFTAAKIYIEFLLDGGYYPGESMQSLSDSLARKFKEYGGELRLSCPVTKIRVKENVIEGVFLDKSTFILTRNVVSCCDTRQTVFDLLGQRLVREEFMRKLETMQPSLSVFVAYLGIDHSFEPLLRPGVNVWIMPHYNIEEMYLTLRDKSINETMGYMIRLSPNGKSLQAFVNAPFKNKEYWIENKYPLLEDFIRRIESVIPNLSQHIVYKDASTPYTMYRYTLNYKGAAYGWASIPSQLFAPEFKFIDGIGGLFLCGHWTAQTQGIPGAAYLGSETAKLILRKGKYGL
ncbi:MAG: NAD(P)/FAD-dependent oxidoreductase [Nitrospirae bacterium]|nr:NAD(P)/FAD-dependent oxidoreductase [Nitrospirota bacterium]